MRVTLLLALLLTSAAAAAQDEVETEPYAPQETQLPQGVTDTRPGGKGFGLGLSIGAPSGLVGKYHVSPGAAVQFGVGGAGHGFLSLHLDYVFSVAELARGPDGWLYAYAGAGAGFGLFGTYHPRFLQPFVASTFFSADVHVTGGVAWNFQTAPFDVFLELGPGVVVFPFLGFSWHGMIGARYYF